MTVLPASLPRFLAPGSQNAPPSRKLLSQPAPFRGTYPKTGISLSWTQSIYDRSAPRSAPSRWLAPHWSGIQVFLAVPSWSPPVWERSRIDLNNKVGSYELTVASRKQQGN